MIKKEKKETALEKRYSDFWFYDPQLYCDWFDIFSLVWLDKLLVDLWVNPSTENYF